MKIFQRSFQGESDRVAMAQLVYSFPGDNFHVADLPYRLCSWAFDYPENTGIWVDENDRVVAWAVLQAPFGMLDFAFHPEFEKELRPAVFYWANRTARSILASPAGRPRWSVHALSDQTERIASLEEAGFVLQSEATPQTSGKNSEKNSEKNSDKNSDKSTNKGNDKRKPKVGETSGGRLLMLRSGPPPVSEPMLPKGYILRRMAGASDIARSVALHQTIYKQGGMTNAWRERMLVCPEYKRDLDLVALGPNNEMVAFCVGWLHHNPPLPPWGQIESIGVHPKFRHLPLDRALLGELLLRFSLVEARHVIVETESNRSSLRDLYEKIGFRAVRDVLIFAQDYLPTK